MFNFKSRGLAACGRCASQKSFLKALALLVLMLVVNVGVLSAQQTAIFSENFESMTVDAVPTGWNINGSTVIKRYSRPGFVWGVYQYKYQGQGNKTIRMANYAGDMKGIALINSPSIQLPTTGPCQLKFKYSHRADCGNFIVKISTNNGSTFTDLRSLAKNGTSDSWDSGTMTEETIDLASYLGQTAIIQFYANANESAPGSIFVDDVTVLGPAPAVSYLSPVYNTTGTPTSGINHWDTLSCTTYTAVTSSTTVWGTSGQDSWYVVNANTNFSSIVTCAGNVHLILMNNCTLNVNYGIFVNSGSATLTIYAQDTTSSVMGVLNATGTTSAAGIGGSSQNSNGTITINGGKVTANGGDGGSGIGSGTERDGSYITINGGYVSATGNDAGAGIGGGLNGAGSYITINGGKVTANGGDDGCAGIGGGNTGGASNITINGGNVTANGGEDAAGIGSGVSGSTSSNIFVADNIILKAGSSANPTTVIAHASITTDVASSLADNQYATAVEGPAVNLTYDTSMYVSGNFTNWQAGMKKLPYTHLFSVDDEPECKLVKRVIRFADNVAVDTTYTWYGSLTANDYMEKSQPSRQLYSTGTYNLHIQLGDDDGDYTFYYDAENDLFKVAWPDQPAPVARIYAKNNWNGGEWTWKEMTFDEAIYVLNNVVYGGTGIYINDRTTDVDAIFYDRTTMHYIGGIDTIQATDTVTFTFNKSDSVLVADLIGRVPDTLNYLHFVSLKGGDTVKLTKTGSPDAINLEYSTDNRQTWSNYIIDDEIALTQGGTVWFRAGGTTHKNATFSKTNARYYKFVFGTNDSIAAGGNVMSLYDATCQQDTMTEYGFFGLFRYCKALVTAPALPATRLAAQCYNSMFNECTSLTTAPALKATQLANFCYFNMFSGCTKLNVDTVGSSSTGVEMIFPATTTPMMWNVNMFSGCHGAYANNIKLGGHYCVSEYVAPTTFEYTLSQNVDETYSGMAKSVSVTVTTPATGVTVQYSKDKGNTWTDGASVSRTNAGTDSVIFKLSAAGYNDTITDTVVLNVNKRYVTMTSFSDERSYNGEPLTNSDVTESGDSFIEGEGATYNVTGSQTNVGSSANTFTYTLNSFTLADNYDIDTTYGTLTVNAVNISGSIEREPVSNQTYTGDSIKPDINARYDIITLVKGTDYTVEYTNNVNVGTATATLTGVGNFTGSDATEFTIEAASISDATIAEIPDATYTGDSIKPALTITFNGDTLVENTDYTVTYSDNVNAGTATATATGIGNFTGTASKNFTIVPASISNATIAAIPNQIHTRDSIKPALTVTFSSNTLAEGTDYTVAYENDVNIGVATAKVTGMGNFTGTITQNFTIVPDTFTVTLNVNNPIMGSVIGAGRYAEYTNATLTATATEQFHFVQWNDGNPDNPRMVYVESDTTFTAIFSPNCGQDFTVTDVDNNVYNTVKIGGQCWLRENLRTTRYADGNAVAGDTIYYSDINPDTNANVARYGRLYSWYAANRMSPESIEVNGKVQGVCPNGWHIPSQAEFTALLAYEAPQMKAADTWIDNSGVNSTNFTAVAGGYYTGTRFENLGCVSYVWSSEPIEGGIKFKVCTLALGCIEGWLKPVTSDYKVSVRCVMD